MPRPISWLPRTHAIRQSVAGSVRSHYQRRDLERLFELQRRSAQLLINAMPTIGIGAPAWSSEMPCWHCPSRFRKQTTPRLCSNKAVPGS